MAHPRRWHFKAAILIVAVLAVGFIGWRLCWPPALYRVTLLPSLGGLQTRAEALNDRGQVVGVEYMRQSEWRLFLWDREHGIQDLGPASGGQTIINNSGQICGTMRIDSNSLQAFIWEPGKGRTMLGTLGKKASGPRAMNNRGQIIGACYSADDPPGSSREFIWDRATGIRELKTPDGRPCRGVSINDAGQILVSVRDVNESSRWFLLDLNGVILLGTIPSHVMLCEMNNASCAAGLDLHDFSDPYVVFVNDQGTWKRLCPASFETEPKLNDKNQIAFTYWPSSARDRLRDRLFGPRSWPDGAVSYLWDPVRGRIPLNRYVRGMRSFMVADLNNNGCIIGAGVTKGGSRRSVLLEPIPERWGR